MNKHMLPGTIALFKRLSLVAILLIVTHAGKVNAQCNIGGESNPQAGVPSGCGNATVKLGAGANYLLNISANTYYNFSFSNNSISNGFCLTPNNGGASSYSGSGPLNNWFSGSTTQLIVSASRVGGSPATSWDGNSTTLTYRFSTPSLGGTASASPNPICQGGTLNLSSSNVAANGYFGTWSGAGGSVSITNATSSTAASLTNMPVGGGGAYTLVISNPIGGCTAAGVSTPSVTVNPTPTVDAGVGAESVCQSGTPYSLSGASVGNTTAQWSIFSGSGTLTPASGFTATPASTTFTPTTVGTTVLRLTTNSAVCSAIFDSRTITVSQPPTANAAGPNDVCQSGTPFALSGASVGGAATTGAWTISSGGGSLSTIAQTSTPQNVTFTPSVSGTSILTLTTPANGACPAATSNRTITVNPAATVTPGATLDVCQSTTPFALTGASIGGGASTGAWSITGGAGVLSSTSPTANPAAITFTPTTVGTVTLTLTSDDPSGPCGVVSATRTINVAPAATVDAGGPNTMCQFATITLTGASVGGGATTGAWSISSGSGSLSNISQTATPGAVTFTPTSSGTVLLTLTTNNPATACDAVSAIRTITVNAAPAAAISAAETSGTGNNDNTICSADNVTLTAQPNGMPGYAWNAGLGTGQVKSVNPTTTTVYQVTVTDGNFCSASATVSIAVNQPPVASIAISETSGTGSNDAITCSGDNATLTANPAAMLSYVWNNGLSSGQTNVVNPTTTTIYNVTVTNLNNCSASATNTVTVNPLPTPTITVTDASGVANNDGITCSGATVGLLANPAGQPLYAWNNGLGSGISKSAAPTATTTYTVTVTNANNCSAPASTTITVNQFPVYGTPAFVANPVLCNGGNTGDITINGSTSNPPLIYSIDNGGAFRASNFFDSLIIGNYNLVIRDNANCQTTYSGNPVVITQPTPLSHTTVVEDASCANVFDGKITIFAGGATPPYSYSLNGGPTQSSNVFSGLSSGAYATSTIDANGCVFTTNDTINNSYGIAGSVQSQSDVSCFGGSDGVVTVQVTLPGIAPYSYSINGVTFLPGTNTFTFSGLTAGNYTATIRDSKGCTAFVPVTIAQPGILQAQIDSLDNILCSGGNTGGIFITVTGGTPGYTFLWSNSEVSEDVTNLTAGTYNVIVTDSKGCSTSTGATITEPLPLFLTVASFDNLRCFNDSTGRVDVTVSGGVPPYSFVWSNGATTEDIAGLNAGTYTLTLTDNNGCQQTVSQTLTQPVQLSSTKSVTNVLCNGASTGAIDITPAGGTTPYSYLWSNGATTQDITAIPAATYTVVITDANGCSISNSTVITQPAALALSTVVTNISCTGNASGSIDLTVTGGAGSYTYQWTGGAITQDISGLAPGTYTVTVTDGNLCTATASGTITQPSLAINGSLAATNVTCNGAADGTINLTVTGGVQPYTYLWSPNGATTEDLTGLAPNTYSVTATDNNGCTFVGAAVISQPAVLTATITPTNVTCFGGSNGVADLTVSGGNPGYTYLWNNFATTQDLNGIPAGNYVVIVNDTKNCQTIQTVTVTQPTQIAITAVVTNIPCNGGTGAINLTVTGGTGAYGYAWTGGGATQDTAGLVAGTYTVTVTDANNCTATATYTLAQPQPLAVTGVVTDVTCNGAANGAINITVTGGNMPFTFVWNNGPVTEDVSGLSGNTYNVTVTDANSCNASASFVVDEPTAITSSIVGTNVTCSGANNGAADLTVSGGTLPYSYLWSNFQSTQDLSGIGGGTYFVIITDGNGCQKRDSVVISETQSLVLTTSVTNVACNGGNTGSINLTVTGGNGTYTYAWTGGGATQDTSGLVAGTYSVTVTDGNGCSAVASATVTQPAALVLNATTTNVACSGGADGSIDITVQGGVFPYTFAWSNGPVTEDVNNLSGGTYTVTITDANSCIVTASYTITEANSITSSVTGVNVTCNGASNGSADLTVGGGTQPYTYLWSNFQGTQDLANIGGGLYYVIITDANGCQKRDSILITEPAALVLSTVVTNVACNGGNSGSIDLSVTGGTGTYSYAWTGGGATQDTIGLAAGTYGVTVTDGNGCTATASATVTQPAGMVLNATTTNVGCAGGANGSVDITVQGGVFPYTFAWSNGPVTEDINGLSGGTYSVTITDANGCTITATYTITEPAAIVTSIAGTNVTCNGANNGAADLTVSGGTAPYTYFWSNFQATQDLTGISGGTYFVIVTDANGCQKRDSVIITEPTALVLTTAVTNVLCNGANTGEIDLTVTGGTGVYTYSWTGGAITQDLTGLIAGTYTVTVTDNTCTATASATVTEPTAMVLNATTTNVGCAGGANGSVDITVQGGVFPYTFAWSNGQVTEDINGLSGGTYSVTITDDNGCTVTATYTITEPAAITSSVVGTNVNCFGGNNGTATLTVSGGTTPYTFLWSNFFSSQNLSNLSAGTYFVIIKDANGCEKRDSVTITQPAQIVLSTTVTNVLCNGALTGAIDLTVTGGVGPYDYTWSNGATTQDLTGVAAGTYTVTVKDANNCTATATATITQPAALVLTGVVSNVSCFGGNDGEVNTTVTGGVLPYTFAWSNGANTEDVTNLVAGTYTLTVTDANGCTVTASYTITVPPAITSSIVTTDVLCFGAKNGTANLTVGGGVPGYTFVWSNFQISEDVAGLDGGVYYVVITDASGCTLRDSAIINEPTALVLSTQANQITCFNANNGSIDLSVAGGTTPYQYSWSNGAITEDISNLSGATYCVTVTDGNGCTASTCVLIINPSSISTNAVIHNPVCNGDQNGSIDVIVAGGTPNYTFAWNTGVTIEDLNNIAAGTYSLTITDAYGCVKTDTFIVTEPSALFTSGFIRNVSCFGDDDGCVDITAYGGTLPYTYNWSTGQSTEDICSLDGDTYFVTVTDAHGCSVVSLYIVTEPAQLTVNVTGTDVSCFGGANGTLTVHPGGGTVPYEYVWDDFNTDSLRTGVEAGLYVVMLTDSNGCHVFDSLRITQPNELLVTGLVNDAQCFNTNTGQIDVTVTGGTGTKTYLWSPNGATTEDLVTAAAGIYTVEVTDANGCKETATFTIGQPDQIYLTLLTSKPTCSGSSNGSLSVIATQGVVPYTYAWNTSPVQTTATAVDLFPGAYEVTVTDANGCTAVTGDSLVGPVPIVVTTSVTGANCFNTKDGVVTTSVSGGLPPYVYQLNGVTQEQDSTTFYGLAPGTYVLLVTDANSCQGTSTFTINSPSEISVELVASEQFILSGMRTQLSANITSSVAVSNITWSPLLDSAGHYVFDFSECADSTNCSNPYVTPSTTTIFTVLVTNADGCQVTDTVIIGVSTQLSVYIPSAFTPNGDGLNDRFEFDILGAINLDIEIFDRWGHRVFANPTQANGVDGGTGWDGTIDGNPAPVDTYVWQMTITYLDPTTQKETTREETGTISLMR